MQICRNLIDNPSQIEKYGDLSANQIKSKLLSCRPALDLLFIAGFIEIIIDNDPRLLWSNTTENVRNLKSIYQILSFDSKQREAYSILIAAEFTHEEAINAIILSQNEEKQEIKKSSNVMIDLTIFESVCGKIFLIDAFYMLLRYSLLLQTSTIYISRIYSHVPYQSTFVQ